MSVNFRDGRRPPQKALEIIVGYMTRVAHPVYLGYVSLEVGYSLARTEEMMTILEDQGVVHKMTPEELKAVGYRDIANIYVLKGAKQFKVNP